MEADKRTRCHIRLGVQGLGSFVVARLVLFVSILLKKDPSRRLAHIGRRKPGMGMGEAGEAALAVVPETSSQFPGSGGTYGPGVVGTTSRGGQPGDSVAIDRLGGRMWLRGCVCSSWRCRDVAMRRGAQRVAAATTGTAGAGSGSESAAVL